MLKYLFLLFSCATIISAATSFEGLTSYGSDVDSSSYTITVPTAPSSNSLVLLCIVAQTTATPTVSGCNMTWTIVENAAFNSFSSRILIYRGMTNNNATTSSVVVDFGGATSSGILVRMIQYKEVNTNGVNGADAVVQTQANSGTGTANPSVTLSAIDTSTKNAVHFFVGANKKPLNGTPKTDWTEDVDSAHGNPDSGLYSMYRLDTTDNQPSCTADASNWYAVGIEIKSSNTNAVTQVFKTDLFGF